MHDKNPYSKKSNKTKENVPNLRALNKGHKAKHFRIPSYGTQICSLTRSVQLSGGAFDCRSRGPGSNLGKAKYLSGEFRRRE
ncbi:hypothetical protein TNCV_319601 [Trichonephila clavipes]|nr:hypothetical protein TNCV_319601 [Trichonephila clavipes]